jgi:hypothetical protein
MSKTITFNADDRQKILADVLAKRLGFSNVSDMLRTWLEDEIARNIAKEEEPQIFSIYKHGLVIAEQKSKFDDKSNVAEQSVPEERTTEYTISPKARSARRARK